MNGKLIKEFKAGDRITSFFVVRKKELRTKKGSGEVYLALELGDSSGRINGTLWEDIERVAEEIKVGDPIKVQGTVVNYGEELVLNIERIRKAREDDGVKRADFLPRSEKDLDELLNRLRDRISRLKNPFLKRLLDSFFTDKDFLDHFIPAPAGKLWHHNRLGGLLEHTLSVVEICDYVGGQYDLVDKDLLLAGAILHDIGKVSEYDTSSGFIEYSDEGRLLGHIVIGQRMVDEKISQIQGFPPELRKKLIHLILSHHGELEQASPVVPMTLEAIILYYADQLDSKADAFTRIIKGEKEPGKRWSKYVKLIDRFIYLGED